MFSRPESREAGGILILAVALAIFLLACGSPPGDPTWPPSQFPDEEKETIQVGAEPIGIAVDYNLNRIYVMNHGDGTVSVIDPDLNEIISTIDIGGAPYDVLWDGSDRLFITDDENDRVVVLRTTDESILAEIPVGLTPRRMALLPTGDLLYVGHRFEHEVWVLDVSDYTVVGSVECQFGPVGVAANPDGGYVFATTYVTEDVRVIRTSDNTVVDTLPALDGPTSAGIMPDEQHLCILNTDNDNFTVFDLQTYDLVGVGNVDDSPQDLCFLPDGEHVLSPCSVNGVVCAVEVETWWWCDTVQVGAEPQRIALLDPPDWAYVTNSGDNTVSVLGYYIDPQQ